MAIVRVPITKFVAYMQSCLENKCGYIMGAYGQDPKKWAKDSWWIVNPKSDRNYKVHDFLNSIGDRYPSVPCSRMLLNQCT